MAKSINLVEGEKCNPKVREREKVGKKNDEFTVGFALRGFLLRA